MVTAKKPSAPKTPKRPNTAKPMLEKDVERYGREVVEWELDGMAYKFVSPQHASVPDRLNLFHIPEEHRAIVARYVRFVEYKAPGKKPTSTQTREALRLADLGFAVSLIDHPDAVDETFLGPFSMHQPRKDN